MTNKLTFLSTHTRIWKNSFFICILFIFLMAQMGKHLSTKRETQVQSLGWEDALEKGMVTLSSILAWRIPWTEAKSMRLQRVRHD